MFCSNCGSQVPDGANVCPNCGTNLVGADIRRAANGAFQATERGLESAVNEIHQSFNGTTGERLVADRSLLIYILLSMITCGIYGYYFIYKMAHDVNIACEGDGETTSGLVLFIVLSFVTCGIYSLIWQYQLGNRLASNAPRYNMSFQENGTTVLMWFLFGSMLCGIGPFIAMHILIKNSNKICQAYNFQHGF